MCYSKTCMGLTPHLALPEMLAMWAKETVYDYIACNKYEGHVYLFVEAMAILDSHASLRQCAETATKPKTAPVKQITDEPFLSPIVFNMYILVGHAKPFHILLNIISMSNFPSNNSFYLQYC